MTPVGQAFKPALRGEPQFDPAWLPWDEALAVLTFEAEREWVRRAREAYLQVGKSVEDFTGGNSNGCY